ncbi:unnamed protein product [Hymenolepis diminuta]|uniref:Uncharacterized protein n=1 Tax=Hymenolepis diminuta TaxID=6216 RepID=A0A564YQF3_HYMDI|nr:unnamed protein product [Hymenolepis diminuta]
MSSPIKSNDLNGIDPIFKVHDSNVAIFSIARSTLPLSSASFSSNPDDYSTFNFSFENSSEQSSLPALPNHSAEGGVSTSFPTEQPGIVKEQHSDESHNSEQSFGSPLKASPVVPKRSAHDQISPSLPTKQARIVKEQYSDELPEEHISHEQIPLKIDIDAKPDSEENNRNGLECSKVVKTDADSFSESTSESQSVMQEKLKIRRGQNMTPLFSPSRKLTGILKNEFSPKTIKQVTINEEPSIKVYDNSEDYAVYLKLKEIGSRRKSAGNRSYFIKRRKLPCLGYLADDVYPHCKTDLSEEASPGFPLTCESKVIRGIRKPRFVARHQTPFPGECEPFVFLRRDSKKNQINNGEIQSADRDDLKVDKVENDVEASKDNQSELTNATEVASANSALWLDHARVVLRLLKKDLEKMKISDAKLLLSENLALYKHIL